MKLTITGLVFCLVISIISPPVHGQDVFTVSTTSTQQDAPTAEPAESIAPEAREPGPGGKVLRARVDASGADTAEVLTLTTSTATVKYLKKSGLSQLADDELQLKEGEALFVVTSPTTIAVKQYMIKAEPGSALFVGWMENVLVVRNLWDSGTESVMVLDQEGKSVELSPGREILAGLSDALFDHIWSNTSTHRRRTTKLETLGRGQNVISRVASNSSFRSSALLESLKESQKGDDRNLSLRVAKLESQLVTFEDAPRLYLSTHEN